MQRQSWPAILPNSSGKYRKTLPLHSIPTYNCNDLSSLYIGGCPSHLFRPPCHVCGYSKVVSFFKKEYSSYTMKSAHHLPPHNIMFSKLFNLPYGGRHLPRSIHWGPPGARLGRVALLGDVLESAFNGILELIEGTGLHHRYYRQAA